MSNSIQIIQLQNLVLAFIPALVVVWFMYRWSLNSGNALYALARMMLQLLGIGYVLTYIFAVNNPAIVLIILTVMLTVASWIALGPVKDKRRYLYLRVLGSISLGGVATLAVVSIGVLRLDPWYAPQILIPLAGIIFASAMNVLSLAIERFESEIDVGASYEEARQHAFRASLIPIINSLFAVGLVSLPGMMTGQIISGVSPLVAVRYQIVVMCMIFGASGISTACYLVYCIVINGTFRGYLWLQCKARLAGNGVSLPRGPTRQCSGRWPPFGPGAKRSSAVLIGVGKDSHLPRPPNCACGFPAHSSPVGSFLIGIGSPQHKLPVR